jgi:hypothetical protein
MHAGKITVSRKWPIRIDKIDTGASNPFTFYILNSSDTMVLVSFPEIVNVQGSSGNMRQEIPLIHSPNGPMQFWPEMFP